MLRNGLRALWILLIALDAAAQPEPAGDEKPAKQERKPWEKTPGEENAEKPKKGDKGDKDDKGDKGDKGDKPAKEGEEAEEGAAPKGGGGSMDSDDPALTERSDRNSAKAKPVAVKAGGKGAVTIGTKDADTDLPPPTKRLKLFGELLIGFGKAPVVAVDPEATTGDSTVLAFMVGGSYDFSDKVALLLRVPWSTRSTDQNGDSLSSNAFGSPELLVEYRVRLSPRTYLPFQLGVGIPIAQGNADVTSTDPPARQQAEVNLLADAAGAWQDGELYAVDRFPLIASVGIISLRKRLGLHAYTKFVFLPNVGDSEPANPEFTQDAGTIEIHGMALRAVTGAGIGYEFLERPRLGAGLESWTVWNAIEPVEFKSAGGAKGPTKFQVVFEPRIFATFGPLTPSIGYVVPVGGRLADSEMQGLRLRLDAQF